MGLFLLDKTLRNVDGVVRARLCVGCGACAYVCTAQNIELRDYVAEGIRPRVLTQNCADCRACVDVCPAVQTLPSPGVPEGDPKFAAEWGPVLEVWEGHATDPDLRFKSSSGGALTAISAYCLEVLGSTGVLHVAQDPDDPVRNRTQLSRDRSSLLNAVGSRYSPASVCNGLHLVEQASGKCVVIGKPAEIAALANARNLRPELDRKIELTLSFFCAETPATAGTLALLKEMGVAPTKVEDLKYRGNGWPGHFAPTCKGEEIPRSKRTYSESWAFLQKFRPWSVQMWPDGSGELADISCGDPWYEKPDGHNPGFSLVVARTPKGASVIKGAIEAGYLTLTPAEPWKVGRSQPGLLKKKGAVWGRRRALRLFGLRVTSLNESPLKHCWNQLTFKEMLQSTIGTVRRVLSRKLYKPLALNAAESVAVRAPVCIGTPGSLRSAPSALAAPLAKR